MNKSIPEHAGPYKQTPIDSASEEFKKRANQLAKDPVYMECYERTYLGKNSPEESFVKAYLALLNTAVDSIKKSFSRPLNEITKCVKLEREWLHEKMVNIRGDGDSRERMVWGNFVSKARANGLILCIGEEKMKAIVANEKLDYSEFNWESKHECDQYSCPKLPKSIRENAKQIDDEFPEDLYPYMEEKINKKTQKLFQDLWGSKYHPAPVKANPRYNTKVRSGIRANKVLDFVRGSIDFDTFKDLKEFLQNLDRLKVDNIKGAKLVRIKDGFRAYLREDENLRDNYPRVILNFMVFDEAIVEVQLCLKTIHEWGKVDHFFYEIVRSTNSYDYLDWLRLEKEKRLVNRYKDHLERDIQIRDGLKWD